MLLTGWIMISLDVMLRSSMLLTFLRYGVLLSQIIYDFIRLWCIMESMSRFEFEIFDLKMFIFKNWGFHSNF